MFVLDMEYYLSQLVDIYSIVVGEHFMDGAQSKIDQISLQESHELFNAGKICLNESAAATAVEKEMPSSLVKKSAEQNSSSVVVIKKVELNSGENSEVTMSADKTAFLEGTLEVEQQMEKTRPINVYKKIDHR